MATPTVDVSSGQITGGPLNPGEPFQWVNHTNAQVTLTNCGNFCTADCYTVPAASGGQPGMTYAQIRENPNIESCAFSDPAWNAPGMPHINNPPVQIRRRGHKPDDSDAPAWISLRDGSNINGGTFALGHDFYWANQDQQVQISGANFCIDPSPTVPAPPPGETYALKKATLVSTAPNSWTFTETPNVWRAPGIPRINNPPLLAAPEREVA